MDKSRVITKESGAVYIPPERPDVETTEPGDGCVDREERSDGRTLRVSFPPAPGVSATRSGDSVQIDYRFAAVPDRCEPVALDVALDVNDDSLPARNMRVEIDSDRGSVRVNVPDDVPNVDVARVVARTNRGAPSEAASVRIR